MDEVRVACGILQAFDLDDENPRASALGRLLEANKGSLELDTLEIYFNRNPRKEEIDLEVGSYVFNLAKWSGAEHKLSEMLLLKGASLGDLERVREMLTQMRAGMS